MMTGGAGRIRWRMSAGVMIRPIVSKNCTGLEDDPIEDFATIFQ